MFVIPAKVGIQSIQDVLDPGFRRSDGQGAFTTPSLITALQCTIKKDERVWLN